ncbi:hypothetical protein SCHPADRAFT_942388 [Schizopora paradoxa]|uniref:CxC2-like cysteine cluster KDZ transposase-associated domain-containing protein n=1 Tax=Schizopora paradoxa TaxID=27342 RepID=A0A0H2RHD5_9AGAM|nr:hypothetical protein SCHPADRAFT_942388 [Schizopora paradoxa]
MPPAARKIKDVVFEQKSTRRGLKFVPSTVLSTAKKPQASSATPPPPSSPPPSSTVSPRSESPKKRARYVSPESVNVEETGNNLWDDDMGPAGDNDSSPEPPSQEQLPPPPPPPPPFPQPEIIRAAIQAKQAKKSGNDTQSVLLDALANRDLIIHRLLSSEALPDGSVCYFCKKQSIEMFRCTTCIGRPITCKECCLGSHEHNPFHKIEKWADGYFQKTTLSNLGYTIHMGHHGASCPAIPGHHFSDTFKRYKDEDMVLVDKSGIWTYNVSWCNCLTRPAKRDQLLDMGLYPATFKSPKTAFTLQLMDYFYFDLLECQTPAANFYSKLRRLTDNVEPKAPPDRYRELMVAARQWYDIKAKIWAGVGHDPPSDDTRGRLTLFCAPCPQPGINLPPNWRELPSPKYIYRRQVNPDGNFGAPNMKTKNPGKEVYLNDGEGTFVERVPYKGHLEGTADVKEKTTCSNLKAVSNANANRKDLECTGVGGCVCARHGCVIPHSMVDFQKGEQQKNMDYCISNALSFNSEGLPEAAVIYDLACQWGVHFKSRLEKSTTMSVPPFEKLITAVGKFHLGSHVEKCFFRHSLNFVEGTGQVDGEIIETLWSGLNPISAMARSMTSAHRQEVMDAATRDWNWKKLTGVAQALATKWTNAVAGEKEAWDSFCELSSRFRFAIYRKSVQYEDFRPN